MARAMDNGLLDLWLKAGSLTRDQVRDIITEWQASRDKVAALEDENAELRCEVEDLRAQLEARA